LTRSAKKINIFVDFTGGIGEDSYGKLCRRLRVDKSLQMRAGACNHLINLSVW